MRRAIYPGSFDPVTNGHLDIIQRGCKLFDEIIVAVLVNPEKKAFFTIDERCEILSEVLKTIDRADCRVTVESFEGLMVQYASERKANAIVRGGLRIRAADGVDESSFAAWPRDSVHDAGRRIFLRQLTPGERSVSARRAD